MNILAFDVQQNVGSPLPISDYGPVYFESQPGADSTTGMGERPRLDELPWQVAIHTPLDEPYGGGDLILSYLCYCGKEIAYHPEAANAMTRSSESYTDNAEVSSGVACKAGPQAVASSPDTWSQRLLEYGVDILWYSAQQGLAEHLISTINLIERHFVSGKIANVRMVRDPDGDDEWLSIRLVFVGSSDAFLAAYQCYRDEFIATIPRQARSKIHLSYGIVAP